MTDTTHAQDSGSRLQIVRQVMGSYPADVISMVKASEESFDWIDVVLRGLDQAIADYDQVAVRRHVSLAHHLAIDASFLMLGFRESLEDALALEMDRIGTADRIDSDTSKRLGDDEGVVPIPSDVMACIRRYGYANRHPEDADGIRDAYLALMAALQRLQHGRGDHD